MAVFNCVNGGDGEGLLIDCSDGGWVLNNEWHLLVNCVLFELVDDEFLGVGDFVRHLDLGGVWNLVFCYEWLLDGDLEWNFVIDSEWEFLLDVESFLVILSHCDLVGFNVWDLLDHSVVNPLG